MTWTKLTDTYHSDPRWDECNVLSFALNTAALTHCSQHLTDGRITRLAATRVLPFDVPREELNEAFDLLVAAGFWTSTEDGKGFDLVGYLEHQSSRESVERLRAENARRTARNRAHGKGDHSGCDPKYCRQVTTITPNGKVEARALVSMRSLAEGA